MGYAEVPYRKVSSTFLDRKHHGFNKRSRFLAIATLGWGIVLITTPACTNFAGIAVNRFLLGVLEGPINPGFVLMMVRLHPHPGVIHAQYLTS